MKLLNITLSLVLTLMTLKFNAQETEDSIEFDDSKNVVHGVYLGLNFGYGEIDSKGTYLGGAKIAYVANKQFEIGFAGVGFYSEQKNNGLLENYDVFGGYGGMHLEPIFFGKNKVSISVPLLIGGGAIGHVNEDLDDIIEWGHGHLEEWDSFFIVESGLSLQYNISRYVQIELGAKYRMSSDVDLYPRSIKNISGFSGDIGVKFGVFNMGRKK